MAVGEYRGIVLRERVMGEANKQIVLLAKEHGKVSLHAKGAKRSKSKLMAATQLFVYGDFITYETNGFYSITQAEVIHSFYPLRTEMEKLSFCAFFAEILEKTIWEGMECNEALRLLLHTFYLLAERKQEGKKCACVFLLRYLKIAGFLPELSHCTLCGVMLKEPSFISPMAGGSVCANCQRGALDGVKLTAGAYQGLHFILGQEMKRAFCFHAADSVLEELWRFSLLSLRVHVNERFRSLDFLLELLKM